jgi:uncharacterized protein (TIGR02284 family)
METAEKTIDTINDLVKINNDRVAGFEKAAENLENDDFGLRPVFNKLAGESSANAAELSALAAQYGGEAEDGTSTTGALHRAWLDVKSTFTGNDLESVLNECERGEDAIKQAYRSALDDSNDLSPEVVQIISRQQQGIIEGHDLIKSLRDQNRDTDQNGPAKTEAYNASDEIQETGATGFNTNTFAMNNELTGAAAQTGEFQDVDDDDYAVSNDLEQQRTSVADSKLKAFFVNELKDLLWAEEKLVDTLPKMADAATTTELRDAFNSHLEQTEGHVERLKQIFGILGLEPDTTKCDAMDGIVDEGEEIISDTEEGTAQRDVGLIFAGQKAEHYEIASYGSMVSLARTLGYNDVSEILVMTLDEEKEADALLTQIAENNVNYAAAGEVQEKGLFS